MAPIRLVTFDITGTLVKFKTPVMEQYASVAAKYGVKADANELGKYFKVSWKNLSAEYPNFGRDSIGWQKWWTQIVLDTFPGNERTKAQRLEIAQHLVKHFETTEAWEVAPNAESVLTTLHKNGKFLGVISNFDPRLHKVMDGLNLTKYFSFVVTSYEVGCSKPDRRIFEIAARLGGVAVSEACHVGNDRRLDFEAARKAGMHGILIADNSKGGLFEVSDLQEVPMVVEKIDTYRS